MKGEQFWVVGGLKRDILREGWEINLSDRELFDYEGGVRVTTGSLGTEIKWSVFSPCYASLFYVLEWLSRARFPVVLRYYLSGWFEEFLTNPTAARIRIEEIISKSELHLTRRTFVEESDPTGRELPPLLSQSWNTNITNPDIAIDCIFDDQSNKFRVERVGIKSTIAKYYGASPVIYPYVNGGSYDEIVCQGYNHVMRTGRARYDHVLAAMRMPDNIVRWVPYQRIIIPINSPKGKKSAAVRVITEIAPVDIHPL